MPRLTDQDLAFDNATEGAVHVLDAAGLPALTWARVAEASGMTVSAVRNRCEGDRDTLLRYTVLALRRDRLRRLREALWWLPIPRPGLACVLRDERPDWLVPAVALIPATPMDRMRSRAWQQLLACIGTTALPEPCHELLRRTTDEETAWLQHAVDTRRADAQRPDARRPHAQRSDAQPPEAQPPEAQPPAAKRPGVQPPEAQRPDVQPPGDAHLNEALLRALLTGLEQAASDRDDPLPAEEAQAVLGSVFQAILPAERSGRHCAEPLPDPLPEPRSEPLPDPLPEPRSEPLPDPLPEPRSEPLPEPRPDPRPEPRPNDYAEPAPDPLRYVHLSRAEPILPAANLSPTDAA